LLPLLFRRCRRALDVVVVVGVGVARPPPRLCLTALLLIVLCFNLLAMKKYPFFRAVRVKQKCRRRYVVVAAVAVKVEVVVRVDTQRRRRRRPRKKQVVAAAAAAAAFEAARRWRKARRGVCSDRLSCAKALSTATPTSFPR